MALDAVSLDALVRQHRFRLLETMDGPSNSRDPVTMARVGLCNEALKFNEIRRIRVQTQNGLHATFSGADLETMHVIHDRLLTESARCRPPTKPDADPCAFTLPGPAHQPGSLSWWSVVRDSMPVQADALLRHYRCRLRMQVALHPATTLSASQNLLRCNREVARLHLIQEDARWSRIVRSTQPDDAFRLFLEHVRQLNDAYLLAVTPHRQALDALAKIRYEKLLEIDPNADVKKARSKAGPSAALFRPT